MRLSNPNWRRAEQLRCGICDDDFEPGEPTGYVDDERCHVECIRGERDTWSAFDPDWEDAA